MAQFEKWFTQDLTHNIELRHCESIVFTNDNLSNVVGVNLFVNGVEYSGGGTVTASVVRSDGATVALAGTLDGNKASVTLTSGCFCVPGLIGVYIRLEDGGTKTTVLSAVFTVIESETGSAVDPGTIIPSVQDLIDDIADAVATIPPAYSELLATIAPTFSASTAYSGGSYVWYDSVLYRFTAAHPAGAWTGADATAVVVGDELNNAVRYDEAQTLTDTQKTTARGNIGAASLIPTGTAFSQAVQGGTTYDVQDTAAVHYTAQTLTEAQKAKARENLRIIQSGVPGDAPFGPDFSSSHQGVTFTKVGDTVIANGTRSGNATGANYNVCVTNGLVTQANNDPSENMANTACICKAGRTYKIGAVYVSGSFANGVYSKLGNIRVFFKTGDDAISYLNLTSDIALLMTNRDVFFIYRTFTEDTKIGFGFYDRPGNVFTNFTLRFFIEDVNTSVQDGAIANHSTGTATAAYHIGDLLMYNGLLYKAIAEISVDDTLVVNTNIAQTTVAAEMTSPRVTITGQTPTITAVAGVRYVCSASYVTSLSFTPSATGICSVRFVSGTTPTVLTLPDTVVMPDWFDPEHLDASRTYEISIADGVYGVVTSWA